MASCKEDVVPGAGEEGEKEVMMAPPAPVELAAESPPVVIEEAAPELASAIEEEEKKAAMRYGSLKSKKSKNNAVLQKRMASGGKQYFDSGDHMMGKLNKTPIGSMPMGLSPVSPEHPSREKLPQRKPSIPCKVANRLQ